MDVVRLQDVKENAISITFKSLYQYKQMNKTKFIQIYFIIQHKIKPKEEYVF